MARLKKEMVQTDLAARRLRVNGIVQGVGFRPFVFQLAAEYDLKGTVANTSSGVDIQVEGPAENLAAFEADLVAKAPPLAFIVEVDGRNEDLQNFADFAIVSSHGESEVSTLIAPDVSICDDCRTEMLNLSNRRYRILSLIAPTAVRATPLLTICPMTAPLLRCGILKCVRPVRPNTIIPSTGAFMRSPMPVLPADPGCLFTTIPKTQWTAPIRLQWPPPF